MTKFIKVTRIAQEADTEYLTKFGLSVELPPIKGGPILLNLNKVHSFEPNVDNTTTVILKNEESFKIEQPFETIMYAVDAIR